MIFALYLLQCIWFLQCIWLLDHQRNRNLEEGVVEKQLQQPATRVFGCVSL